MPKKEKFSWEDVLLNPDKYAGENIDWSGVEIYATPDWVRHPEKYPELYSEELREKVRELLSGKKEGSKK